jgi:GGDEF domain-containing protein
VATPFGWFCEHALTADPLAAAHVRDQSLAVAGGLAPGPFEIEVRFDPVDSRWFRLVATSLPASVGGALVTLTDITPELEHDALVHRVHHDALTGLPNRVRFSQVLGEIVAAPEASLAAVLFIDLDRFKHVNDTYGHAAGDELLVAVAQRLQAALRPGDTLARLAGDEFAACCPDLSDRPPPSTWPSGSCSRSTCPSTWPGDTCGRPPAWAWPWPNRAWPPRRSWPGRTARCTR